MPLAIAIVFFLLSRRYTSFMSWFDRGRLEQSAMFFFFFFFGQSPSTLSTTTRQSFPDAFVALCSPCSPWKNRQGSKNLPSLPFGSTLLELTQPLSTPLKLLSFHPPSSFLNEPCSHVFLFFHYANWYHRGVSLTLPRLLCCTESVKRGRG